MRRHHNSPLHSLLNKCTVLTMVGAEELAQEIASISAHVDAATHRLLECIRQFDECGGWYQQGAVSCAHWLAWRVGLDAATAREKVRVARALGKLPAIDGALAVGKLSYAKVRALTRWPRHKTKHSCWNWLWWPRVRSWNVCAGATARPSPPTKRHYQRPAV
jgi:hypothetical protein